MVLSQSKFPLKCYKSKYFHVTFHLLKYYKNQIFKLFSYIIQIITHTNFDTNFLKSIILHFHIVNVSIIFSVDLCFVKRWQIIVIDH